jgi:hypothetical protein
MAMTKGDVEKNDSHVEHLDHMGDGLKISPQYDRFGSAVKSDPREIALVKKIDIHMMVLHAPISSSPHDIVNSIIANPLADVFSQLSGSECHGQWKTQ